LIISKNLLEILETGKMKKFILEEMSLISLSEKKAKKVSFHPKMTIILGGNDTGKSCLLKSIYATFGADSAIIHPNWQNAEVTSLIKFIIKDVRYYILKYSKWYSIFNSDGKLVEQFESVSKGLNEFISELFDFKLKLVNRKGEPTIPPPAFLFLPFYIDQDCSWSQNWSAFKKLHQYSKWRDTIVYYHTGIRPNEYYETKSNIEILDEKIKENENEINILKKILGKIKTKLSNTNFDIDINSFKEEIKSLLVETEKLNLVQNKLKAKLTELYNVKITLESQIKITQLALSENEKDYKFSLEEIEDDHIACPTCGAEYSNSFGERFEIAQDEQRCSELLQQLNNELTEVNKKIFNLDKEFVTSLEEKEKLEEILQMKQGEIRLKDLIDSEGKKQVKSVFEQQQQDVVKQIESKSLEIINLNKKLKLYDNKKRKDEIVSLYKNYMNIFLNELDVNTLKESAYKNISTKINEVGSTLPRALAAYYFSILHIINKYSSTVFCPIIIDEPNQQGQDDINLPKLLRFIKNHQPDNSQLILGLENTEGIDFDGSIINVSSKNSLLQQNEYDEVYEIVKPFINSCLSKKGDFMF
jgi:hypothetical protein